MIVTDPRDYAASDAVSFSKLRVFEEACPLLYYRRFVAKRAAPREETAAMRLGTAAHCLILEGDITFRNRYAVRPTTYYNEKSEERPWNGNAGYCKEWEREQETAGRLTVSALDRGLLTALAESVHANQDAAALLRNSTVELAMRVDRPGLPAGIQGRIDSISEASGTLIDLKTIENLSDLRPTIEARGYYRQLAFYRDLFTAETGKRFRCAIIGAEKAEPNRCVVYYLSDELLDIGAAKNARALDALAAAYESGDWGGNPATEEVGPSPFLSLQENA